MATGTIYKSNRLMYSSGINLVGLTNAQSYFVKPNGTLGATIAAPQNQTWNTLLQLYTVGNGIYLLPDNAVSLVLMTCLSATALTGSAGVAWYLWFAFDPPAYTVPSSLSGGGSQPGDLALLGSGPGTLTTALAASTSSIAMLSARPGTSVTATTTLGTGAPPPRYFMLGLYATTWPTSAGTTGPIELYYT